MSAATPELNLCPSPVNICMTRGDATPFQFTLTDDAGAAIDISGDSFLLTVDPSADPPNSDNNLFQLVGSLPGGGTDGVVQFEPSAVDTAQPPSTYYFDVQQTTVAGDIRTIVKGEFAIQEDITK